MSVSARLLRQRHDDAVKASPAQARCRRDRRLDHHTNAVGRHGSTTELAGAMQHGACLFGQSHVPLAMQSKRLGDGHALENVRFNFVVCSDEARQ